jgi:hypothetical protein
MSIPRDDNRIPLLMGELNTDGVTPVAIKADPNANTLNTSDGVSGTNHPRTTDARDANRVTGIMGVSYVDGITPVEIYADINGNLLTKST